MAIFQPLSGSLSAEDTVAKNKRGQPSGKQQTAGNEQLTVAE
jgi:hypothetical protein